MTNETATQRSVGIASVRSKLPPSPNQSRVFCVGCGYPEVGNAHTFRHQFPDQGNVVQDQSVVVRETVIRAPPMLANAIDVIKDWSFVSRRATTPLRQRLKCDFI